jgi:hypothetical protein
MKSFQNLSTLLVAWLLSAGMLAGQESTEPSPTKPAGATVTQTKDSGGKEETPPLAAGEEKSESSQPGALPWEKTKRGPAHLQGFRSAREMLKYLGVESSEFEGFFQNEPLTPAEEDVLFKLLYLFPRLGLEDLHRWRKESIDWAAVQENPNDFRGEIFRLRGRAKSLQKMPLIAEVVDRYEFDHYYRIEVQLVDAPVTALICSRTAPANWEAGQPLDEPISADAMFLKLGEEVEGTRQAVFAAQRISWHPEKENERLGVSSSEVQLAKLGFDVGLLSDLTQVNYQGIGPVDREPFYALLDALKQAAPGQLPGKRFDEPVLIELLENKTLPHGEPFRVTGNARKIIRVRVDDPDIRQRFGIDHYYQVDFFIPLDKAIKFGKDRKDRQAPIYENGYPATLCLLELPPGMTEGDNLRQAFQSESIFYKMWSYPTGSGQKQSQRQAAPMFLGRTLMPVDNSNAPILTMTDIVIAGGLVGSLVIFGAILWWASSRNKPGQGAELVTGASPVKVSLPEENAG